MARPAAKPKVEQALRLARTLDLPEAQCRAGVFKVHDVANHSDADQRHMIRSGEKRTVRRLTHLEKLHRKQIITRSQLAICEWYSAQREMGYSTLGVTANYCGAGGGGFGSRDLLARYRAQGDARSNYIAARIAIDLPLISLFERIVIAHEVPKDRDRGAFEIACKQLEHAVGHLVSFE